MLVRHTHAWRRRLRESHGAALVELAIVLPLVMVLLLGMLDFGKAFNSWIDETHLANVGARLASVNYQVSGCTNTNTNICLANYIQGQADTAELKSGRVVDSMSPAQNKAQVCISYPNNTANSPATHGLIGDPVLVTVHVDYKWFNYLNSRLNLPLGTTPITGKATMRLEQPAPSNASGITSCSS